MLTTLIIIPCVLTPRIDNLADYAAGLLAIQRQGTPQTVRVHPADRALLVAILPTRNKSRLIRPIR